jgi:hypothetical protein
LLSLKRLREHLGLFAAVLGVVALVSGLSVGVVGFLAQSASDGVRVGLASRAGADLALRASLRLDADAAAQDAAVRQAIDLSFADVDTPITIDRIVDGKVSLAAVVDGVPQLESTATALSITGLEDRADLVDGAWPASADEVTMQADAAAILELESGDRIQVDGVELTVAGTWRVRDFLDPRWLGDTQVLEGTDRVRVGPVVIDESVWSRLEAQPRARWTLVPDRDRMTATDLATLIADWDQIDSEWRGSVSSITTLEKQGRLRAAARELQARVDGLRAIQPVVLLLLAAIALVTLAELGRLLTTTRSAELALLWARGATATDIALSTARETALAAGIGAVAGIAAGLAALAGRGGLEALLAAGPAPWVLPIAVTITAVVIVAGSAFRSASRQTVRDPSEAAGRARLLAGPGLVVLLAAAAGLSVWQLRLYGSPVIPTSDGGAEVDPVAVVAPALALIAIVVAALFAFPAVAALHERVTRRSRVTRTLAARTVSRRLALVAAPIVVVAVAAASVIVAAGYAATWSDSFTRTAELRAGSDVHAVTTTPGIASTVFDELATAPGVQAVAPIVVENLQLGGDNGSIVAISPTALMQLATTASGSFDRQAVADAIRIDVPGPALPEGTTAVLLTAAVRGFAVMPQISLHLADASGVLRLVPLGPGVDAGPDPESPHPDGRLAAFALEVPPELAATPGPWQVMTVDVDIPDAAVVGEGFATFDLVSLEATADGATAELPLDAYWVPEDAGLPFAPPTPGGKGTNFAVASDSRSVRMTPSFDGQFSDKAAPPVVISQELSEQYRVGVGDRLSFFLDDTFDRLDTVVAAIVPAIPGAPFETAVMIDLGVVQHYQLRVADVASQPTELWIASDDPEAVGVALRGVLPANARINTADDPAGRTVLGSAVTALWLGAAGCGVLAVIALLAVVRAQLRSRRLDVAVLRALGLTSRDQGSMRRAELSFVLGYGALTGLVAGAVVTFLTMAQLARAAVPEPYDTIATGLHIDLIGLGAGLGALAVAVAVIVVVYAARVAAQARSTIGAEEAR